MLLLLQGVAVPIPSFKLATEDENKPWTVEGFTVIFARQDEGERKKRARKSFKSVSKAKRLQEILLGIGDKDAMDDDATLDKVTTEIEESDKSFEKQLYADIKDWRGLKDTDGSDVPYTSANKKLILQSVPFRNAILSVWSASTGGVLPDAEAEATVKN